jgi:hypothetical protein
LFGNQTSTNSMYKNSPKFTFASNSKKAIISKNHQ